MKNKNSFINNNKRKILISFFSLIALLFFSTVLVRAYTLRRPTPLLELNSLQQEELDKNLNEKFPIRNEILVSLPYATKPVELDLLAKSAIAVDVKTGCVLYEKNADEIIPPASMTKLFVMYVVFNEIKKGIISLKDVVPLPPECWACNMPPHSSLMFLGKNQIVTLEELMTGLAVCSGNDASYAIAYYLFGGVEPFINKMNEACINLGLKNTHFVETSGYSENNTTTAKEMAKFARHYLDQFPESLSLFHSKLSYAYPQEHNLAPEDKGKPRTQDFSQGLPENITMEIYQKNTNPLLGLLEGCDGLKTGYIDESGYNLALTATRKNMRILSITMQGPGNNPQEGNAGRVHDGTTIMEWAFSTFQDYENPLVLRPYSIPTIYTKSQRINLIPAFSPKALCIPKLAAENPEEAIKEVKININLPKKIKGEIKVGAEYGYIEYMINSHVFQTIPLVADRNVSRTNLWISAADFFAQLSLIF